MVRIDSVSLLLPLSTVQLNSKHFIQSTDMTEDGVMISDCLKLKKDQGTGVVGLHGITANRMSQIVKIDLSSKLLKEQYYEMINVNTVDRLVNEINKTSLLKVSPADFWKYAGVGKMDTTLNVKPEGSLESIFSGLACLPVTDNYNVTSYNRPGNKGVVFAGRQKTFKERQIFYDKLLDVQRDRKLQKVVPYSKLYEQFKDTLRIETNFTSYSTIRKYCGLRSNSRQAWPLLSEVLISAFNPNVAVFDKITRKVKDIDLQMFQTWEGMKLYEIEKLEGRKTIIQILNFNMVAIAAFIRSRVKGDVYHYIRKYREVLKAMNVTEGRVNATFLADLRLLMLAA